MKKYSKGHSWLKLEDDGTVTVGITKQIVEMIGEIVYIEPPKLGSSYDLGNDILALEATKSVSDIEAPISGEIIEFNNELEDNIELVNEHSEDKGWLYKMKPHDITELKALLDSNQYQDFVKNS